MDTCSICLDDVKDGVEKITLKTCFHVFHEACLVEWVSRNIKNPKCPYCRQSILFERNCNKCKKDFHTPFSVQVTCDLCRSINAFLDAVNDYCNRIYA